LLSSVATRRRTEASHFTTKSSIQRMDELIASRMRDVGEQGEHDNPVIRGAPVRPDNTTEAESCFEGLMR
jgi:hypothetical protein